MADHQPAMGTQHRDVVGDRLGVGGADADVDQADAAPVGADDMIGRHLEAMPDDGGRLRFRLLRRRARIDDDVARQHQLARRAGAQLLEPPMDELVDIAVVVGQQQPRLHRAPVGAGVVDEPAQRVIDPHRVEQRDRPLETGADFERAVGDLVADRVQLGNGKEARELGGGRAAAPEFVAALEHVRIGDFLRADADLDRRAEFLDQRFELLEQIGAEILRLRDRRRVDAGLGELGEGARARRRHAFGLVDDPQLGIAEARAHRLARRNAVDQEPFDRRAQRRGRLVIERGEPVDRL